MEEPVETLRHRSCEEVDLGSTFAASYPDEPQFTGRLLGAGVDVAAEPECNSWYVGPQINEDVTFVWTAPASDTVRIDVSFDETIFAPMVIFAIDETCAIIDAESPGGFCDIGYSMGAARTFEVTAGQVLRFAIAPDFATEQSSGIQNAAWSLRIYSGAL